MFRTSIFIAAMTALATIFTPTVAQAWGAAHVGYTHVGANGAYHYGRTAAYGPNGAYSGAHAGAYGYRGNEYHAGYGNTAHYGNAYHYNTGASSGYHYGTVNTGGMGAYYAGVHRR